MRGSGQFESEAAQAIHAIAARLENVNPSALMTLELPPVSPASKAQVAERLKAGPSNVDAAIYAISLPDAEPGRIHAALAEARNGKADDRCYSRVLPLLEAATPILYVGSSRSLQKRLLEHLGQLPSIWSVPPWLDAAEGGVGFSYHKPDAWLGGGRLRAASRGQEFVADVSNRPDAQTWIANLLEAHQ